MDGRSPPLRQVQGRPPQGEGDAGGLHWVDAEAARWVWEHIPPHLRRIAEVSQEMRARFVELELLESECQRIRGEIVRLLMVLVNESTLAETQYRSVGEWMAWRGDDGED